PAIPMKWKSGLVKGLRARGAFEVNIKWNDNHIFQAEIISVKGNLCKVRTDIPMKVDGMNVKPVKTSSGYVLEFKTEKGKKYRLSRNE
ncbi:MAG: glycoside hydrolase family 95 protein, partial [Bacteroidetes bacterium]|nr:glycoside hydrolase family 95 protein [Bacteroidota bacterium]